MTGSPAIHSLSGKPPGSLTPFIGRQADLELLLKKFGEPSARLVTILGEGGVGKTRFALELAGKLQAGFQHGAIFIPLTQLGSVDELLPVLAETLGVRLPPGGDLQQALLEQLGTMQVLLVLDNFEHLLDEAALVREILLAGPQVRVLVTSREKLNLENEILYHLRGMALPPGEQLDQAAEFDAVSLFLQKAELARPGFALNAENTPDVIRICRLVDGNSLGILLAAALLEHFSPAEIADQTSTNLDFLASNLRDAPSRHSCMRAVFEASYNRLDERQKAIFRKLAVFRGGFSLKAAEAITGADLRTLLTLVDKSLLGRDPNSARYDLHELLRQFANEELTFCGEREHLLATHAEYYAAFVFQREKILKSLSQATALDEIHAEFDNIRQAWSWAVEKRDVPAVRSMSPGIYAFCDMRSQFYEGEAIFRQGCLGLAPKDGEPPDPTWALVLLSWYDLRVYIEPFDSFEPISSQAQACLEQAKLINDAQGIAASQVLLGAILEDQLDFGKAIQRYQEGIESYPALDDIYWINMRIGLSHQAIQEYPLAIQAFRVCLQRGKVLGERVKQGWSLLNIGDTLVMLGDPAEAQHYLEQARVLFQEVGTTVGVLWAEYSLSRIALALSDPSRSREHAESARRIAYQLHSTSWIRKTGELLQQIDPQPAQVAVKLMSPEVEPFSQRELEVLQLLKSDLNGPEIARRLVISLNTVRYHTKNIYQKLQVNNRLEAIHRAKELDL
jgi:predicted ATPase/DNA-binding CsgD family transcriptional regulator